MASVVVNGDTSGAVTLSAPAVAGTVTVTLPSTSGTMLTTASTINSVPQVTVYTTSSGTYTVPTNCRYLQVRMAGGGGGGAGGGSGSPGAGGSGGSTTFGTSLLTCTAGAGGTPAQASTHSIGGLGTINSPATGLGLYGGEGSGGNGYLVAGYQTGMSGGTNPFGGAGSSAANSAGFAAQPNTGAGGGGGGSTASGTGSGGGGAAGGYIDAIITSPSATYSYAIGAGGTAGTAGTNGFVGGAGAAGIIFITAFF